MVGFADGGLIEAVAHEESGLLVPAEDVTALAVAIARLADDNDLRGQFAAAGRSRLFRAFERTGDPDAPAGLGLRLALVRVLAEAQGGGISYEAVPGGGAAFTLTLPATA